MGRLKGKVAIFEIFRFSRGHFFALRRPPSAPPRVCAVCVAGWERVRGWLVGLALVCAFLCAFVSAFVCSFRGLFACVDLG
jgi:hypothetical protein